MTSTGSSSSDPATDPVAEPVDVLIGIPAYNLVRTVEPALRTTRAALREHLSGRRVAIALVDGGSTDGTRERAAAVLGDLPEFATVGYTVPPDDLLSVPYHGLPGRAQALTTLFETAQARGARACIALDAGAAGLTTDGLGRLAGAILHEGFDYAAADYLRPLYSGALSKSIVAPMFRACYGVRLRQPLSGEFACSPGLVGHFLDPDGASLKAGTVGVNLRLETEAVIAGFRLCEVVVGSRSGEPREDALDLSTTLAQVVGALFAELDRTAAVWHRVRRSVAVPMVGPARGDIPAAQPPDVPRLIEAFRLGYRELREIWVEILPPSAILALKRLADAPETGFRLEDQLWARIVYDFALTYRLRVVARDQGLRSLTPLYLGWLASFILEIRELSPDAIDERLERIAQAFEVEKPYLISGWRWPERFAPTRVRR